MKYKFVLFSPWLLKSPVQVPNDSFKAKVFLQGKWPHLEIPSPLSPEIPELSTPIPK